MRRATKDPSGAWGVVTVLRNSGCEVLFDDGTRLQLVHHDMAGHGSVLAEHRRAWVQLQWGWLWVDEIGISVATASAQRPCLP